MKGKPMFHTRMHRSTRLDSIRTRGRRALEGVLIVGALASASGLLLVSGGPVQASSPRSSETFTFADPFDGSFECDGFSAVFAGHDHGIVTTWFDPSGNPIMQEGHVGAIETDTNLTTGKSVVVTTRFNVHTDYQAGTTSVTGIRNISNQPRQGVVIQSVGRLVIDLEGIPISHNGPADDINIGGGFCEALAG